MPRLCVAVLLPLLATATAYGQAAQLAHGDGLRANSWELLAVEVPAVRGGATVAVRDVRGGPSITRPLGDGATRLLLPLPAIDPADLPTDPPRWPIYLSIMAPNSTPRTVRIEVPLPAADSAAAPLRLALPQDIEGLPAPVAALGGPRPELIHLSDEEILSAPLLLFAAVDALYLPHRLTQNFPEERAAALAGVGVRLLATEDEESGLAALRRLAWVHVPRADGSRSTDLWAFPAIAAPRPVPVNGALTAVPGLLAPASPEKRTRMLVMLLPAEALILWLLAASIFRRDGLLLAVAAGLMIGLAAGNVAILRSSAPALLRQARWVAGGGGLRSEETLAAHATLFPQEVSEEAPESELFAPLWPSSAGFFAQTDLRLNLDQLTDAGQVSRIQADLGARQGFVSLRRLSLLDNSFRAKTLSDVSRLDPATSDAAWWIIAGHLVAASAEPPSGATPGVLAAPPFTDWLPQHPEFAGNARAWYELRFSARNRYLLLAPRGQPPRFLTLSP